MEFDGLKISTEKKVEQSQPMPVPSQQLVTSEVHVSGAEVGEEFLAELKSLKANKPDELIYGVNDGARTLSERIDDFFVDHKKISVKDKSYFFHMLAVMIDAGIPAVEAVKSLAPRTENRHFQRVLNTIAYSCSSGATLADAMSRFYGVFDDSEIGIVRSGEATGRLNQMLFRLSDQLTKRHELYAKLWGAAFYPLVVLSILVIVAVVMLIFVFPKLLSAFVEGGIGLENLPATTRFLIWSKDLILGYWWAILAFGFMAYALFSVYKGSLSGAVRWDYFKLRFPLIGNLLRKVYVLRFTDLMGILIEAGLPVISALKITANTLSNRLYKLKIKEVIAHVQEGKRISESLSDTDFLFPNEVVRMFEVGEKSASLAAISEKISTQYQREIDNSLKKMTSVFEPLMIVFVGLTVALLAMAVMSPIFNLTSSVSF